MDEPNAAGAAIERLDDSVTSMKEAMAIANRRKPELAGLALEAKLVDVLDAAARKKTMVRDLLRRTRQANTAAGNATMSTQQRAQSERGRRVSDREEEEEG